MDDWNNAEQRAQRAAELFEQHRWQEAAAELRAATAINPYNSSWFFNLGITLDQLARPDEAIEAYQNALAIDPHDVQTLHHLGADFHEMGRFDDAVSALEKIESLDAGYEPAYCGRILSYANLGQHQRAEEMFSLARLYKEHCPDCYHNMGVSLAARKMYNKAIFCWQQALDLEPA